MNCERGELCDWESEVPGIIGNCDFLSVLLQSFVFLDLFIYLFAVLFNYYCLKSF